MAASTAGSIDVGSEGVVRLQLQLRWAVCDDQSMKISSLSERGAGTCARFIRRAICHHTHSCCSCVEQSGVPSHAALWNSGGARPDASNATTHPPGSMSLTD